MSVSRKDFKFGIANLMVKGETTKGNPFNSEDWEQSQEDRILGRGHRNSCGVTATDWPLYVQVSLFLNGLTFAAIQLMDVKPNGCQLPKGMKNSGKRI